MFSGGHAQYCLLSSALRGVNLHLVVFQTTVVWRSGTVNSWEGGYPERSTQLLCFGVLRAFFFHSIPYLLFFFFCRQACHLITLGSEEQLPLDQCLLR